MSCYDLRSTSRPRWITTMTSSRCVAKASGATGRRYMIPTHNAVRSNSFGFCPMSSLVPFDSIRNETQQDATCRDAHEFKTNATTLKLSTYRNVTRWTKRSKSRNEPKPYARTKPPRGQNKTRRAKGRDCRDGFTLETSLTIPKETPAVKGAF
jgi:hypothetical protein